MLKNRILKNYKHRRKWAKSKAYKAYRLYEKDIPEFPFIIDLYGDHAVIYEKGTKDFEGDNTPVLDALFDLLETEIGIPPEHIILKQRWVQTPYSQYRRFGKPTIKELVVTEGPFRFSVNLWDYIDTGLFLDHRPLRRKIFEISENKNFLNLFSYTGSMSVCAALGGAKTTVNVDLSKRYLQWSLENFKINGLSSSAHTFIQAPVQDFLGAYPSEHFTGPSSFDLIFLDPPTFSNSKSTESDFEVERDQEAIIPQVMALLEKKGTLYFSTNKRKFKLAESILTQYRVEDITQWSIPEDFRDAKIHKCFILQHKGP